MYRQSPSSGGMGTSHTSITLAIRREAAFLLEEFRVQYSDRVQSQLSALISVGKKKVGKLHSQSNFSPLDV